MYWDFVLFVRACENCPSVPVLYLYVPKNIIDFFAQNPIGESFEDWIKEKLERKGIHIPKDFLVEHPVAVYRKGYKRDVLISLPEVYLP
jgi:hypothetical protein